MCRARRNNRKNVVDKQKAKESNYQNCEHVKTRMFHEIINKASETYNDEP